MAFDPIARGLAASAAAVAPTAPAFNVHGLGDGSIVALGDSLVSNAVRVARHATDSDTWQSKGVFAMLLARSGGRLRPVQVAGWPYNGGANARGVEQVLISRGGSGYSPATTLSFDAASGGTGAAATPVIADGVIVGVTVTAKGQNYSQSPFVTVTDPGGGSGAVLLAQVNQTGAYAIGSISSLEAEAYLPLILTGGAGGGPVARNCLVLIGTNNAARPGGPVISLADSKASILRICAGLIAGGVRPFVVAMLPRNGTAGAGAKRQAEALRRWQLESLPTLAPGAVVLDAAPWLVDASLGNEVVPATIMPDGLHPSIAGADLIARQLWLQMAPRFTAGPSLMPSYAGAYDATYNPNGSLLGTTGQNLMGNGTATPHATNEASWTGTRSSNVYLSRKTGGTGVGTVAASVPARTDGKLGKVSRLQIAVSGATQGETYRLIWTTNGNSNTLSVGGGNTLQVGHTIKAGIDEATFSNVAGLRGVKLRLYAQSSGGAVTPTSTDPVSGILQQAAWGDYEETGGYPTTWNGDTLRLETREMVIPASTTFVTMVFELVFDAGSASCTVDLSGAWLQRVDVA